MFLCLLLLLDSFTHDPSILLNLVNIKYHVLVALLVHAEFACLAECCIAPLVVANEGLQIHMDVGVLLQVLCKSERFETNHADVLLDLLVRSNVSSRRELGRVGLVTARLFASVGLFHLIVLIIKDWSYLKLLSYQNLTINLSVAVQKIIRHENKNQF